MTGLQGLRVCWQELASCYCHSLPSALPVLEWHSSMLPALPRRSFTSPSPETRKHRADTRPLGRTKRLLLACRNLSRGVLGRGSELHVKAWINSAPKAQLRSVLHKSKSPNTSRMEEFNQAAIENKKTRKVIDWYELGVKRHINYSTRQQR